MSVLQREKDLGMNSQNVRVKFRFIVYTLAILSLSACWQSQTPIPDPTPDPTPEPVKQEPIDSQSYLISKNGSSLILDSGESLVFEAGFFEEDSFIYLLSSEEDLSLPSIIAKHYPVDAILPLGKTLELIFPKEAVAVMNKTKSFSVLPDMSQANASQESELRTQVLLKSADGSKSFYEEALEPDSDVSATLRIWGHQLKREGFDSEASLSLRAITSIPNLLTNALPSGFVLEDVATNLALGVAFDFAPDGRIFIAEKAGTVRIVQNGQLLASRFIDISAQVNSFGDRGLLGIAVHPNFPVEPYVYLSFTYDPPQVLNHTSDDFAKPDARGARVARVIRLTADANEGYNKAVAGSELILLGANSTWVNSGNPFARNDYSIPACGALGAFVENCLPADETSHTIGALKFGLDGSLFVASGDGCDFTTVEENCTRALSLDSLAGKILRIDAMTGEGLASNPFYDGNPNSNASKVYNLGLRNPFRFTLDPVTGEPVVGDVGWGTWEEINKGRGANFAWPCYEGGYAENLLQGAYAGFDACQAFYASQSATPALYAYAHAGTGNSIQVGDFYAGTSYPVAYRGALFFSDFNDRFIKYLQFDASGALQSVQDFGTEAGLVQLSTGADSNFYLMNIYEGKLKRLRYVASSNNAPVAQFTATPVAGSAPLDVSFSNTSYDADGEPLSYAWDFGDGGNSTEASPVYTYANNGVYTAILNVTDTNNATTQATKLISVGNSLPVPVITSPAAGFRYNVGDTISFTGSATDGEDGNLTGSSLEWSVILHHNEHRHFDGITPVSGTSGSFVAEDHGDNTYLELCLTATDSQGASQETCQDLYPNTVQISLDTVPSGLQLSWQGVSRATPFTVTSLVGSSHSLTALNEQGSYRFSNWSNGGARVHSITLDNQPRTFVATYEQVATCAGLIQEAETAGRFGAFAVGTDAAASGGAYAHVPQGFGSRYSFLPDDRLEFCINVPVAGDYQIKTWVYASGSNNDSFYVKFDDLSRAPYLWFVRKNTSYLEDYISSNQSPSQDPLVLSLSEGQHRLYVYLREQDTRLDKIELEPVPANQAPVLRSLLDRSSQLNDAITLAVFADDPENDTLSFSATGLPSGLSMSTTGVIQGQLSNAGSFTVNVTVSDGDLTDTASFNWLVNEGTATCGALEQEAENGLLLGTFQQASDPAASGGAYVYAPTGSGIFFSGLDSSRRLDLCFNVTTAGLYRINTSSYATSPADDSFYVTVNGLPAQGYIWDMPRNASYSESYIKARGSRDVVELELEVGQTLVSFYQREENARLDKVELELVSSSEPPVVTCAGLSQEAEIGGLSGAFEVVNDGAASGGAYVYTPTGSGFAFAGPGSNKASYCVTVATAGEYRISANVYAATAGEDSFFVTLNGLPANGYLWDVLRNTTYAADYVRNRGSATPVVVSLEAGDNYLDFYMREDGARLDKFTLELVSSSEPPVVTCAGLSQEAEIGGLSGAFEVVNDGAASGGAYVYTPTGSGFAFAGPGSNKASYCVTVATAGEYRISANVYAATAGEDSFFVTLNGLPANGYLWDVLRNTTYAADYVRNRGSATPVVVSLEAGDNYLDFYMREDGARLDKFTLEPVGP